jgi:2-oxoglutarate dehydrogenase E2 component (dihydrolipoamide succinyltransferase)
MDVKVPQLGESITEAVIARWLKKTGEEVHLDEPIAELETDKINVEVNSPSAGILKEQKFSEEATVAVGDIIAVIEEGDQILTSKSPKTQDQKEGPSPLTSEPESSQKDQGAAPIASPAAQKISKEKGIDLKMLQGTGKEGRITKEDVVTASSPATSVHSSALQNEERVKMSRLRQRIAERLKESQNTAAMLTTFNEIDMSTVISLRKHYKDVFEKRHGVKLGFMSFFTKAAIAALHKYPAVNAEIDGTDIVYKKFFNIGIAVGTEQGLVVPVLKNAQDMEYAEIEATIAAFGKKARDGKLELSDLSGGTFTISNGGVYGSLLSTPILNPPQSGILGLHKIEERPVVVEGEIVVRPMMYVALSYDHRLIDGKEAVGFLVAIKEFMEDPHRLLLNV